MFKTIFTAIILFCFGICCGQAFYPGQIVTKNNDTINVRVSIDASPFDVDKLIKVQDKVTVVENGAVKDYFPGDIKGFRIRLEKKLVTFDDINGEIFAQRLYTNKVQLYKTLINTGTTILRFYKVKKPLESKWNTMISHGLSRLIKKDDMLSVFADCQISCDKIRNNQMKITDEIALVDFIKDYETNCLD
jgi:hypothetical protein